MERLQVREKRCQIVSVPRSGFGDLVELAAAFGKTLEDIYSEYRVRYVPYNPGAIRRRRTNKSVSEAAVIST